MRVESFEVFERDSIPPAVLERRHLIYPAVKELDPEFRVRRVREKLEAALAEGGVLLLLEGGGGAALVYPLVHETRHFGLRCARISLLEIWGDEGGDAAKLIALIEGVQQHAREDGLEMLWVQTPSQDYAKQYQLEERAFRLADTVIEWSGPIAQLQPRESGVVAVEEGPFEAEAGRLGEIAEQTMRFNRFEADPRFSRSGVRSLYTELGAKCARGEIGDAVLVARGEDGAALGFASLEWAERREKRGASLSLGYFRFLVRERSAPRGSGQALLDAGCRWFRDRGADHILAQTVIQNCGVIRSAFTRGFRVESSLYDWFWWKR